MVYGRWWSLPHMSSPQPDLASLSGTAGTRHWAQGKVNTPPHTGTWTQQEDRVFTTMHTHRSCLRRIETFSVTWEVRSVVDYATRLQQEEDMQNGVDVVLVVAVCKE